MFGLSIAEILVILVVALIVLGPERLPGIAKTLGKTLAEFRRTVDELKFDLTSIDDEPPKVSPRGLRVEDFGPDATIPETPREIIPNCDQLAKAKGESSPEMKESTDSKEPSA